MILQHICWDDFDCLEPSQEGWLDEESYWEDYLAAFFRSNGIVYNAEKHSNIREWLTANDRAPFASMAEVIVSRLKESIELGDVDVVLLAHWLPDVHLGTSVTNFVMHLLGNDTAFGFALSDRGLSAPFFAIDCIDRFLKTNRRRALLLVMDQKNLLYKSDLVKSLSPSNSACAMVFSNESEPGVEYLGYYRHIGVLPSRLGEHILLIMDQMGLDYRSTCVVTSDAQISQMSVPFTVIHADPRRVCAAPFIAFGEHSRSGMSYLLLTKTNDCLTGVGFRLCSGE